MFSTGSEEIRKQKEKAFAVFTKAKRKLLETIESAKNHIDVNTVEINERRIENTELWSHVKEMENSVGQINSIIGG